MYIYLPTRKSADAFLHKEHLEIPEPKVVPMGAVKLTVSGKDWVFQEQESIAPALKYTVKQNTPLESVLHLPASGFKTIQRFDKQYIVVATEVSPLSIGTPEELQVLLKQLSSDNKYALSYLIDLFASVAELDAHPLTAHVRHLEQSVTIKEDTANKVVKEYFNKQLRGDQLYHVPKYLPQTGNWDDKQTIKFSMPAYVESSKSTPESSS